jgi:type II secretory pathway pseudopilin PulG
MWNIIATILVFAVIAAGLVEVYQNFGTGQAEQTAQGLSQETATAAAQISTMFAGNPDFTNITTASSTLVPTNWKASGTAGQFTLPEGGTVTFAGAKINGSATDNGYSMAFTGISQSECQALAGFATQKTASIAINGTSVVNTTYGGTASTPAWGSNLVYLCVAGSANTVTFTLAG